MQNVRSNVTKFIKYSFNKILKHKNSFDKVSKRCIGVKKSYFLKSVDT